MFIAEWENRRDPARPFDGRWIVSEQPDDFMLSCRPGAFTAPTIADLERQLEEMGESRRNYTRR